MRIVNRGISHTIVAVIKVVGEYCIDNSPQAVGASVAFLGWVKGPGRGPDIVEPEVLKYLADGVPHRRVHFPSCRWALFFGRSCEHFFSKAIELDLACNMAKQQGRNRAHLYNPADLDKDDMAADMEWAAQVREMLEHDRFQLVYQPIVSVNDGEILDYEVLVRMVCDDGKVILPGGFMPAAERFGLIHSVDRWIVKRAILQLSKMHQHGQLANFSINLSGKAFEDHTLLPMIQDLLNTTNLDPGYITFEITETAAIANLAAAEQFISALKDIGCLFALDDFGSGFSSFAYLKHLAVDKLKIDGSFVKGMAHSSVDQAMVESMNQVAHALGKQTVAECVENAETLVILKEMGIDRAQGNYIGRPNKVPALLVLQETHAEVALQPH